VVIGIVENPNDPETNLLTIVFQELLRPKLPSVRGCKDYEQERELLERVDRVMRMSGVERKFLELSRVALEKEAAAERKEVSANDLERHMRRSAQALRCTVLKALLGVSFRELSKLLAHAPLYRWFSGCEEFAVIRVPGKSTLYDYAHWLEAQDMEAVLEMLTRAVSSEVEARRIGLENSIELTTAWVDTTCVKAMVHFPTDWVLLRDAVRTIMKSIVTIRRHGLCRRMPEPESFLAAINAQAMKMSAAGRKPGSKKLRKQALRAMKRISQTAEEHGQRYRNALDKDWQETDLTRGQAEAILRRLDNVLAKLPEARHQAHERIIGGRPVANADKILSLYEEDIRLIKRGKAGADIEFGNSLFVAETAEGFILDHELRKEASPGDAKWLKERYPIMQQKSGGALCGVISDRGFDSKANREYLAELDHFNGLCPRDPAQLGKRCKTDEVFVATQRRRAQTEGRIGILQNVFLGGRPRAKGFEHRQMQVIWAVLAHNLWVIARLPWAEAQSDQALAA